MKVYKLTNTQVNDWSGIYETDKFEPIKDSNGNWVCNIENAENKNFPFADELISCPIIDYIQPPTPPPFN